MLSEEKTRESSAESSDDENPSGEGNKKGSVVKEYQTLFWVPMLFQTAKSAESLIDEMLDMINDFHEHDSTPAVRKSILDKRSGGMRRRQQILGDVLDSEVVTTRVDVVMKSESTKFQLLSVLKQHFLFSRLRDYELEDVIDVMQFQYVAEDEVIIQEGDSGDLFYILEEGECSVYIGGECLGTMHSGSSFGDLALMYNCPRAATIKSLTDCSLWTLDRVFFRQAMVTSSSNQNVQLSQFLSKIALFANLGVQTLNQLARSLTKQSYEDGQYIIRQGDIGDQFYVIYKGTVNISMTDDSGTEKFLIQLGEGEVFGERALIKKEPRKANVVANGPVECYFLESHDFHSMLGEFVGKFNKMNEFRIIRAAKVFAKLSDHRLKELIKKFEIHRMFSGQRLVCGINMIYIVLDGQFSSSYGETFAADGIMEIGNLERGADASAGALTAISEEGRLASFSFDLLEEFVKKSEEDEDRKVRRASLSMMASRNQSMSSSLAAGGAAGGGGAGGGGSGGGGEGAPLDSVDTERQILLTAERRQVAAAARKESLASFQLEGGLDDLAVLNPLGKGTFGNVFLCRPKSSEKLMALKCLDKVALIESGQHLYVRREIVALQTFQHPFIAEFYSVMVSARKIFLLLEFISGGELWSYLYDESVKREPGKFGGVKMEDAALYAATVLLALEHIHGLGYSYRDLKPENLLISENGYIKIVDFGFAKQVPFMNKSKQIQYRTFTLCGTPDYMSPELVLTQGHDKSTDYWSFGVLIYELLCGHTPFESSNQQRVFERIVHSQKHLSFPRNFDPHCKSLVRKLLHPNAALRLGALQGGITDIKNHAFFTNQVIDYEKLLSQAIEMPHIPPKYVGKDGKDSENSAHTHIDQLDLEFELQVEVDDDLEGYFHNLDNPDMVDEA